MASLQVVIPYLTQSWCLQDCLGSFGDSDIPVLIVDNSENNEVSDPNIITLPPNVEVQHYGRNIGVSASWNKGLEKGADQTLIVSQWVRFAPAELIWRKEKPWGLDHVARGIEKYGTEYGCEFADQGYHCISIGRETINQIGMADPNLFCFGNDDDMQHRRDLAGIRHLMGCYTDHAESGVHSIAFAVHQRTGVLKNDIWPDSTEYYIKKWGSIPGHYEHPFNDETKGLDYWPAVVA
jgi:hypothetical protein